jgi:glycosyltransferase involved in cell wall biosynthesis
MLSITVIVPTYNSEKYITRCLSSLLCQTLPIDEILVIDDGSTDNTIELVQKTFSNESHIRIISASHFGVSKARNIGINLAIGDLIGFLDSDDTWDEAKWEIHYKHLITHEDCVASFSNARIIPVASKSKNRNPIVPSTTENILLNHFVVEGSASSVIIRRDLLLSIGGFDTNLNFGEDWDLWIRVSCHAKICSIERILVSIYQVQGSSQNTAYPGLKNFHLTESHIRQWERYIWICDNSQFGEVSIRLLWSDIRKNIFNFCLYNGQYSKLFKNINSNLTIKIFPRNLPKRFYPLWIVIKQIQLKLRQ